jgi:hydroxymethylpyrimidine pyrophosphatase-like HAD family hydrolase
MRYLALATDYDGTLAHDGRVDDRTVAALERLRATGRRLVLVTGRELDELLDIFPEVGFFERVVAENGALLYDPATKQDKLLAQRPPDSFLQELRRKAVHPVSVGRVIVATWKPQETAVLAAIRDQGLDLQVIFNKDAVMVLPAGVTKATGLAAAMTELDLSPHEAVGIGDAENDHAFLSLCECSAAVANALASVKQHTDLVTKGDHGAGVVELIERLIETDLADVQGKLARHQLLLGTREDGTAIHVPPYGLNVLIAGPSGSGKSTAATGFLERLLEHRYQFCIIDPEGDYEGLEGAVSVGHPSHGPAVDEVLQLLKSPETNAAVNLVGLPLADRPSFFLALWPRLQEMRARTGRPHWIIVEEAHHLLPAAWKPGALALPQQMDRMLFITVHPDQVTPAVLNQNGAVVAVGRVPAETLGQFCVAIDEKCPRVPASEAASGEVIYWPRGENQSPFRVRLAPSRLEHHRHVRKYAEGELPPDRSFYFRGPEGKLNLRAQNLILFTQLAEGVDDETWMHHLREGAYSRWFRESIKDEALAAEAEKVERLRDVSPQESRKLIRAAVERHYTLPASAPLPMPGTDAAPTKA